MSLLETQNHKKIAKNVFRSHKCTHSLVEAIYKQTNMDQVKTPVIVGQMCW